MGVSFEVPCVQVVSAADYASWLSCCVVLEKDRRGPKVLRCDNGDYLKVFRIKRAVTLSRVLNPARRFCRSAARLMQRGVPTVTPLAVYRIPHLNRWAVRYAPLAGTTLRELLARGELEPAVLEGVARFIAQLHRQGVYFRSLHPGNIVLTPQATFGLIDVLDCHFNAFGRPLSRAQRRRNFSHFFRYEDSRCLQPLLQTAYAAAEQDP